MLYYKSITLTKGEKMRVSNMTSNKGNKIANQFVIDKSIIAFCSNDGKITLDEYYWDYSTTTGKYRNQFLNEGIAETRKKIKAGTYVLTNLN